jgi:hypothetical protein
VAQIDFEPETVLCLSFTPDGKTLATAGPNSTVRFWETDGWRKLREVMVPQDAKDEEGIINAIAFAPEGNLLATSHDHQIIRVWQVDNMTLRKQFALNRCLCGEAFCFSPDGLWLAIGTDGGSVELWDPLTGKRLWNRGHHSGLVRKVSFGRDSRTLTSGGYDGVGYVWDLRPPEIQLPADVAALWGDLAGQDPMAAYTAMWCLSDAPDRAVALLSEKLRPVEKVVDLDRIGKADSAEEKQRRQGEISNDPKVETAAAVRRGVALLSQIGTPAAIELLEDLAKREANNDVGGLAARALKRLEVAQP